jgi:hypothetical protein
MRIVFLDDSGQADPPRPGLGRLQALGAAIFPEGAVAGYTRAMAAIKDDLGIPPEEEIKWNPDRTKSPVFASSDGNLVAEVRRRMLKEAIMRHVRTVVVIVDHHQALEGPSAAQAGMKILKWLYERVSMHLGDNHDFGIMIADKPGGGHREESRWLGETLRLTSDGTRYVRANKIVLPIVTAESRYVPHLQLADLVTAATTAAVAGRRSGLTLAPLLTQLMHRHRLNAVNGAGLILHPDNLYNLLYWCFGESIWAMPSTEVRLSLPFADWPYSIDDGLGTCGSESAHGQAPLDAS